MNEKLAAILGVQQSSDSVETVIEPRKGWLAINWREIWKHRELLYFLTWRDVKVRYKQTVLGVLWAFLQPFVKLVVFTFIFGVVLGVAEDPKDYILYVCPALLPWQFFQESLSRSSASVVGSPDLISKVFFPRLIIPISSVGACLLDFAISFPILVALMVYFKVVPTLSLLMVVPLIALTIMAALGVGSFLSALNVAYRDFRYVVPFMLQIWMFLTPVLYRADQLQNRLPWVPWWLPALNPMWGIAEAYRAAVLPGEQFTLDLPSLLVSAAVTVALLVFGAKYFRRIERRFADII
ncbi:MAG: ABC transporter permease [Planctomycetota bacterium]|jgi:lipopolysaccharide transport system permease protein